MADRRSLRRDGSYRRRPRIWSAAETAKSNGHDGIARRAYELFERRGRQHGRDLEDWLGAELELRETGDEPSMADGAECPDGSVGR